jgi:hypothetical protein
LEAKIVVVFQEPYYYRDNDSLYALQTHDPYWFHVGRSETKQAIMGLLGREFCIVIFDQAGNLVEVQENALISSFTGDDDLEWLHQVVGSKVEQTRRQLGLADETILVKRFHLPKLRAGLSDLPDDLREYLVDRRQSGNVEDDLEEALEGWKEESLFEFWWGQSFSVDSSGAVCSS